MSGALPFNLERGLFWGAAIEVVANQLTRKKVIFEISGEPGDPELCLFLNESDHLVFEARDRDGKISRTKPVNPTHFAFHRGFLIAEIYPHGPTPGSMILRVAMDGQFDERAQAEGRFSGEVKRGSHAFGADRNAENPATMKLFELVVVNRAPLSPKEYAQMATYMRRIDGAANA